ncbi:hypothetical protein WN51_10288 [Melipona quadrifasciata]|uniref:Uncharacterized protein n=1 Tax=Melipona quadrifasciata TaxID=166423 RepID=A0A0N0BI90_9HYME|nr:hypothetical protein WN51_10288 [Melipona quadrifasciata]
MGVHGHSASTPSITPTSDSPPVLIGAILVPSYTEGGAMISSLEAGMRRISRAVDAVEIRLMRDQTRSETRDCCFPSTAVFLIRREGPPFSSSKLTSRYGDIPGILASELSKFLPKLLTGELEIRSTGELGAQSIPSGNDRGEILSRGRGTKSRGKRRNEIEQRTETHRYIDTTKMTKSVDDQDKSVLATDTKQIRSTSLASVIYHSAITPEAIFDGRWFPGQFAHSANSVLRSQEYTPSPCPIPDNAPILRILCGARRVYYTLEL